MEPNKQQAIDYIDSLTPSFAGKLIYYCLPFRKRVVLNNIATVYDGILNIEKQKKLAKAFYSHIASSLKENFLMRLWSEEKVRDKAEVIGADYVIDAAKQNKGVLILTGHFGNWEFAPIAGILNFKMFQGRFFFIRKLIGNKTIERILFRRYYQAGLNVIPKKNALTQVCDALEKNNAVVFVLDQHACIRSKDGIKTDFFGKPAGTYRSLATIARNMKVPVIPAQTYRRKDGKHILEFMPAIHWTPTQSAREGLTVNTQIYNEQLEKMILRFPEQWLWMHKRWKL